MKRNKIRSMIYARGKNLKGIAEEMNIPYVKFQRKIDAKNIDPEFARGLSRILGLNAEEQIEIFFGE